MKLTEETQRKIYHHFWAEPKTSGQRKGRIVAKSMKYLHKHISAEVSQERIDMELVEKYQGDEWNLYIAWAEDLIALLREEAEKGGKKQRNILMHAAKRAEHWTRRAEELKGQPNLRPG